MTPTTAPFATHNRRVQRTTAETPHPQHLFVSRLSPPAARRLSLPHFHADKQPGRGLYSACRAYCAPRESRTGPIPASFTSPTSLPRSPAGPAQAAFGVKPSTIPGTIPGPKAGVRPPRAPIFRARRRETANTKPWDEPLREGDGRLRELRPPHTPPKTTSPDHLLRAQPPPERCRNANANVDRNRNRRTARQEPPA